LDFFADAGYRAVAMSLRRHGTSPTTKRLRSCSIADYLDDLGERLTIWVANRCLSAILWAASWCRGTSKITVLRPRYWWGPYHLRAYSDWHDLRRELNTLVSIAHHRTGKPHGWIHNELRRRCGGPPIAAATRDQLKARIEALRKLNSEQV
jgi:alpha-beta hydrolase superfamily lysophospholipase